VIFKTGTHAKKPKIKLRPSMSSATGALRESLLNGSAEHEELPDLHDAARDMHDAAST